MVFTEIIGVVLLGTAATLLPMLIENMWPVGSWQWGVLITSLTVSGVILICWNRWVPKARVMRSLILAFVVIVVMWLAISIYRDISEKWIWVHSSLPVEKQIEIKADCKMRAIEALNVPETSYGSLEYQFARRDYINACMRRHGFYLRAITE